MLPGIDMFRLFTQRLLNRQNPFKPDKKHLHMLVYEYLLKKRHVNKTDNKIKEVNILFDRL